ncbi:tRNA (N6-isopentenyl adenosine(37)-C2)-methylthiotransferase MiaB [candidate division KSB1 bacterium]|nr:tRNA (N6-isopentenyl adenosine(37)-C2)-methylthiotransferase MiaB [candidate division KSB1 bacterium]
MKKVYFETYGCQMNKYDSELVAGILKPEGYEETTKADEADLILINTCSVREHAETRVFGRLDALRSLKKRNPEVKIGLLGCMAVRLKNEITEKRPFVNFVIGPDNYRALPKILSEDNNGAFKDHGELSGFDSFETYGEFFPAHANGKSAWVAIMRGCNNFCSYCIVPYVRGRERSRSVNDILTEIEKLADQNYLEVTLLGQNVNSYDCEKHDFADLIEKSADVPGIERVRFATSHPKDLSQKLIEKIAGHPNICNHIHLPVQSGSDKILKLMNRKYSRSFYLNLVKLAREKIPNLGLYTDVIVGFPGETEKDFLDTVDLIEQVEFDGSFIFKYSPRLGTAASKIKETLTENEKVKRLQKLNEIQNRITLKRDQKLIGTNVKILVEGKSKKAKPNQYMGRTESNKIVVFNSEVEPEQRIIDVRIVDVKGHTLFGEIV